MRRHAMVLGIALLAAPAAHAESLRPTWQPLPALPDMGALAQIGRSGMCAGTSGDGLLFAGGANFPEPGRTASRGGAKTYYDDVFVLQGDEWRMAGASIPVRADSFLSVQDGDRVICIGGQGFRPDAEKRENLTTVFAMRMTADGLSIEQLPDLPAASVLGAGGRVDDTIIATAGMSVFALDLSAAAPGWREVAQIPGPHRSVYGGAIADGKLWIVGGRQKEGDVWSHFAETHSYDPESGSWTRHADFPIPVGFVTLMDGGDGKLVTVGGVDADYFLRIQSQVIPRNREEPQSAAWKELNDRVTWLFDHHPGFMAHVFGYDMAADSWTQIGWHPGPAPINRSPVRFEDGWVLAGGEVSAGKRTPYIWKLSFDE